MQWQILIIIYVIVLSNTTGQSLWGNKNIKIKSDQLVLVKLIGPWGIWLQCQISKFQTHFNDKYLKYFLWNCFQVNATTHHWSIVNIGSGNGLMLSGNKPYPEPMLT